MGSEVNANDEWIELYNFSSSPEDLTGWTVSDSNAINISLSGIMPPHGVFLLERTDDDTVPGIAAHSIYTGALSNSGATLTIKDKNGNVVERLVGGENWENIGGDNELKFTPQRNTQGEWVTGAPTPGAPNVEENATELETQVSESISRGGGGGPARRVVEEDVDLSSIEHVLELIIDGPDIAYVSQPVDFTYRASGAGKTLINSLSVYWNFGDTYSSEQKEPSHTYAYPGEYIVVLEGEFGEQHAATYHTLTVLPINISIATTTSGDIVIQNNSPYEVDIGGYTLKGTTDFIFPKNTILMKRGSITVSKNRIGNATENLALYDGENSLLATVENSNEAKLAFAPTVAVAPYTYEDVVIQTAPADDTTISHEFTAREHEIPHVITIGNAEAFNEETYASNISNNKYYGILGIIVVLVFFLFYTRRT